MSDAPEVIWIDDERHEHHWHEGKAPLRSTYAHVVGEYRRADLPPTLAQAMQAPEVREMVDALGRLVALNEEYAPFGGEIFQDRVDRTWEAASAALASIKGQME